jgi:hypothetical protein
MSPSNFQLGQCPPKLRKNWQCLSSGNKKTKMTLNKTNTPINLKKEKKNDLKKKNSNHWFFIYYFYFFEKLVLVLVFFFFEFFYFNFIKGIFVMVGHGQFFDSLGKALSQLLKV